MSSPCRIVITDDHKVLANGIVDLLKTLPQVLYVGSASSPESLKQLLRNQDADMLILDYRLGGPAQETHQLIQWLIQKRPAMKIIIYSGDDVSRVLSTQFPGAIQGYVLKNDEPAELMDAIVAVIEGKNYRSHSIRSPKAKKIHPETLDKKELARKLVDQLSKREKEVLIEIAKGKKNREIADIHHLAEDTVKTHRRNIIKKTKVTGAINLGKLAEDAGLLET